MRAHLTCFTLLATLGGACGDAGLDAGTADLALPNAPDAARPLPSGVTPIVGGELEGPDEDLSALDELVGGAVAVGLGESIHTSGGYHDVKARLVRRLVERHGFRVLAWEWQRVNGDAVERYLQSDCSGGALRVTQGLSVWSAVSVQRLLAWACVFNSEHPGDEVHFIGIDTQQPHVDIVALEAWLPSSGIVDPDAVRDGLARCDRASAVTYTGEFAPCMTALERIADHLAAHGDELEAQTSHEAVELIRIALVGAEAWQRQQHSSSSDVRASYEARDVAMADVYRRLMALRFPGQRAIVWAHDYHLRKAGAQVTGVGAIGARTLGEGLVAQLGDRYRAIGITGYEVEIDWPGVGCGPLDPPDGNDSIEAALEAQQLGDVLIDFRRVSGPLPFDREAEQGAGLYERMRLVEQYDGLVFLHHSAKMTPLSWPDCQAD